MNFANAQDDKYCDSNSMSLKQSRVNTTETKNQDSISIKHRSEKQLFKQGTCLIKYMIGQAFVTQLTYLPLTERSQALVSCISDGSHIGGLFSSTDILVNDEYICPCEN